MRLFLGGAQHKLVNYRTVIAVYTSNETTPTKINQMQNKLLMAHGLDNLYSSGCWMTSTIFHLFGQFHDFYLCVPLVAILLGEVLYLFLFILILYNLWSISVYTTCIVYLYLDEHHIALCQPLQYRKWHYVSVSMHMTSDIIQRGTM